MKLEDRENDITASNGKESLESMRSEMITIEKSKEDARNLNELMDNLIKLIESNGKRFSIEFCVGGTMEIYDKEKEIGYAVRIVPIEFVY